ncbi:MAG TPA: alkaline phosphatase family protein [Vicinamibacterales bacterium]|nr:alkaline phosphatase family protein [Vicinamibacterales bacterium]
MQLVQRVPMFQVRGVRAFVLMVGMATVITAQDAQPTRRNAIIFVADGLRHGSVNPSDTPALYRIRTDGVYFANSHAVFPTQTMPNATAIATGHTPGDTGQFANQIFIGYPLYTSGTLGQSPESMAPDVEDPFVLADINRQFGGNYIREASLLAYARSYGYNTAAVGKTGPAAAQDLSEVMGVRGKMREPVTIILDGATGTPRAVPLSVNTRALLSAAGLPPAPPVRAQSSGTNMTPGTREANVQHQQWFADAATKAILPAFAKSAEPFVLVYWSGDPDLTQHAQGDSLNQLSPGINGPTSRAAIQNADRNLQQILNYLDAHPAVRDTTNVFVTSDHGFSTVSRRDVDATGRATRSYSATLRYTDAEGRQEVNDGFLPIGFLAIDLARELNLPLYDPEQQIADASGGKRYARVDPTIARPTTEIRQHPTSGAAILGGTGRLGLPVDATVIIAQASIYIPGNDRAMVRRIARFLATQDYVGGLFVHDRLGRPPGTLRMSDVGLMGGATTPKPAIVVSFKSFPLDASNPHMTGVIVGGTRQHGQGEHGSLSRANTFNNMAAIGPDFKKRFVSQSPLSNADVQPTLAHVMRMKIPSVGDLTGRVLVEALAGGPATVRSAHGVIRSGASPDGLSTVLMYQVADRRVYLDDACFTKATKCE